MIRSLVILYLLATLVSDTIMANDEHVKMLKEFVPDHEHLHELVDKTHAGDVEAKHKFERESLSVRFNATRSKLPPNTDDWHVVLHFLDDYTEHVTGGKNDHQFMKLEPFLSMLNEHDDLREEIVGLGKKLEKAECDFTCFGDTLTDILNKSIGRMVKDEL